MYRNAKISDETRVECVCKAESRYLQLRRLFSLEKEFLQIFCYEKWCTCGWWSTIQKDTLTMAVHSSSNVILLAIEYFIDSKGERQNIKLLSTQNNYSPSFGLKKLVIFFISSDKTDKKLCRCWKYKTRCRTKRRGGQGTAFDQGASRPQSTITAKNTGAPQDASRLKLKKIQRI